ncbi:MAG: hypothetical protein AAFO74_02965 [Pseudomonadota bacterium]
MRRQRSVLVIADEEFADVNFPGLTVCDECAVALRPVDVRLAPTTPKHSLCKAPDVSDDCFGAFGQFYSVRLRLGPSA